VSLVDLALDPTPHPKTYPIFLAFSFREPGCPHGCTQPPGSEWLSKVVIGAADGTGISKEEDNADQQRRINKYGPML
jgi:hypothetical protein